MAEWFLSANFVQGQYLNEDQIKVAFSIELHWVVSLKYYAIHSFLKVDSSTLENFVCVCVYIYVFFSSINLYVWIARYVFHLCLHEHYNH